MRLLDNLRLLSRMGKIVGSQGYRTVRPYGSRPWHIVTDRDDVATIWAMRDDEMKSSLARMRDGCGESLLTSSGAFHTRHRAAMVPSFRTTTLVRENAPQVIEDLARKHFAAATSRSFRDTAGPLALDVLLAVMRLDPEPDHAALYRWVRGLDVRMMAVAIPTRSFPPIAAGTRSAALPDDWTDVEHRDEIASAVGAGDTSSVAMAWAVHEAIRRPEVLARLATDDDEYLRAFIKETLRYRTPPAIIARITTVPLYLPASDVTVPAWDIVAVDPHGVHRDPARYERPDEFRPERWIEGVPHHNAPLDYVPFSAGARRCIGQHLAQLTLESALRIYFREFTPAPLDRRPEGLVRRVGALTPKHGTRLT